MYRVFTVFSTSKDHGQGKNAMAGCILVDFDKIQVSNKLIFSAAWCVDTSGVKTNINVYIHQNMCLSFIKVITRSPAYKNKYVHHRTSIGCELSDQQVIKYTLLSKSSVFVSRISRCY